MHTLIKTIFQKFKIKNRNLEIFLHKYVYETVAILLILTTSIIINKIYLSIYFLVIFIFIRQFIEKSFNKSLFLNKKIQLMHAKTEFRCLIYTNIYFYVFVLSCEFFSLNFGIIILSLFSLPMTTFLVSNNNVTNNGKFASLGRKFEIKETNELELLLKNYFIFNNNKKLEVVLKKIFNNNSDLENIIVSRYKNKLSKDIICEKLSISHSSYYRSLNQFYILLNTGLNTITEQ